MDKDHWNYLLFLLAAHHPKHKLDHTLHVGLAGKSLYLCTRCTGVAAGVAAVFTSAVLGLTVSSPHVFVLVGFLPVFAVADWFTQSARLRQSTTPMRLATGFLLGVSEGFALLFLFVGNWLGFLYSAVLAGVYAVCIYGVAAKTKCLRSYLAELNGFGSQEQALKA